MTQHGKRDPPRDRHDTRRTGTTTPLPPSEPRRGIAELLALLDGIRTVAFNRSLTDGDVARGVRGDLLREHRRGEDFGDYD